MWGWTFGGLWGVVDYTTTFTILFGTTITFFGVLPAIHFSAALSVRARRSTSALSVPTATSMLKRGLPLNITVYFTLLSLRYSSLKAGHCASHTVPSWPSTCHSSSQMCGANGASTTIRSLKMALLTHFCE